MTVTQASPRGTSAPPRRRPRRPTATLAVACFAQFMVMLDLSVVNVSAPAIRHALGFSEDGLHWIVNAYTITFAGFLLLGGRAGDIHGRRRVLVAGLLLFSSAALAGGLASDPTVLIVARLAQGLGAAIVTPASLSILTTTFVDRAATHRAVGLWAAMGGAGGAAGVLLGGMIIEAAGWRWTLLLNVPLGLLCALAAGHVIAESYDVGGPRRFDVAGALSATAGLSALVGGIVRTAATGWGDATTLALMGAGVALLAGFLLNEGRWAAVPLVPLRLFRSRALASANAIVALIAGATFAMWFFLSLYMQDVRHYGPLHTGLAFLPMTVAVLVGSVTVSRFVQRLGAKRLLVLGMTLMTLGLAWLSQLSVDTSYVGGLLLPGLLAGFSIPLALVPGTITATTGVEPRDAGIASGIVNTSRMFGGALGLAILTTVATAHSREAIDGRSTAPLAVEEALTSGFALAFLGGAAMGVVGIVVAVFATPATTKHETAAAGRAMDAQPDPVAVRHD